MVVTVSVTDVDEAPVFDFGDEESYTFDLAENADGSGTGNAVALGSVSAADPDVGDTVAYSIPLQMDRDKFAVDSDSGDLSYVGAGEDFEAFTTPAEALSLTVRAASGTGTEAMTADVVVTVSVTDVDEAPVFGPGRPPLGNHAPEFIDGSSATRYVSENTPEDQPIGNPVEANDFEGDTIFYCLGGPHAASFKINSSTGQISTKAALDREAQSSYRVTVAADDGNHGITVIGATIRVTDVDEAPVFDEASYTFDLAENSDGSTTAVMLGRASATDPDGDAVAYSIESGDPQKFAVDSSGELTYTGSGEDHEAIASLSVAVRATSSTNGPKKFAVDSSGDLAYTGSGEDHEAIASFSVVVRATSGTGGPTADVAVEVSVTDVDEAPVFDEASYAFDLVENTDGSTTAVVLGRVSADDSDGDSVSYSILSGGANRFEVGGSSGELFYTGSGEDHEAATNSFSMVVRAISGIGADQMTANATVTVMVIGVNEAAPTADAGRDQTVDPGARVVLSGSGVDSDAGDVLTYAWSQTSGTPVALGNAGKAALSFTAPSSSATLEFALTVSDGVHTGTDTVTVSVRHADERPSFESSAVAAQVWTVGREISRVQLPAAVGGDGVLRYSLAPSLPAGLSFSALGRTIAGTPQAAMGRTLFTLTAIDEDGDQASFTFSVTVNTANYKPGGVAREDVELRDRLIFDQEALLNVYRCLFDIDTQVVPGGCAGGEPSRPAAQPAPFGGTPTLAEVELRDQLIASQEALLNVYRCKFDIDTQMVPGGCIGREPAP